MRLEGKVCLITGAASGIGKATTLLFAQEGATVIAGDISKENLDSLVKEAEGLPGKVDPYVLNVTDRDQIKEVVEKVVQKYGRIDVLVNNAGITRDALLVRMKEEDWDAVINVNLKGVFNVTQMVVPYMIKQRNGSIVNVSSVVGIYGNPGQTNYAASKAGVIGMTKTWAKELAGRNIRVNAVAPGFIETPMTEKLPEKARETALSRIPLGRFGKPEEVAQVILFLASDESSYVTGQVIGIDGGLVI
ncbi:short-chain dehydrogenase [Thermotoga maritima MSB8]|uniref:3-oxoacyl-[acyl-carrier-protein] reductase FabG n=1 Tax=Thermotoga maritima (strain ATCC 43589 / DSM 3109 / JCM 10099 / NBRC 100826 / MSB8) TaxID=243274 RepID=FABG_THEMA|nr:3-oxoacyl-[acyl-carrier-protein] reductase [Thermotoga maritima]Q9X248.1 RecName: Full=3-oxoacyl-[acyl-carrier-protein] reductase FabG; AltName: Full=3-ketoacyl-acyl carrier protein reductase; AltName: Full=Beta-Ketoacyl-acyl carrier protein reductase; AltName: Full=Beta-ketoacyl-ACP reductase [Thermotoga maritima MSB8]AAD36790.1 3-oxoacyl-(acyl carrier protein) reductase [Thermotoga maritima MSB8]AGL50656.1 3-oxoacyl-(acyl-carrier-protein) reductase [Thermotoga maritima MSB8]AHD18381.1 shor